MLAMLHLDKIPTHLVHLQTFKVHGGRRKVVSWWMSCFMLMPIGIREVRSLRLRVGPVARMCFIHLVLSIVLFVNSYEREVYDIGGCPSVVLNRSLLRTPSPHMLTCLY